MMMTSGGGAKYKGSIDCAVQIMKNEGFMSMMKGAGAQRSPWCCWRWCPRWFRQVPGHVHRVENQPLRSLQHLHCRIKISSCRLLRLYKTLFTSIVSVSDCSN